MWLFALFVAVPVLEIALFIQVGGAIGLFPTLLIVVLTAFLGTFLVRQQGALAMSQVRNSFSNLSDPTAPLAHGAMILFSGALLLTPGFFTDAVGFALLVPKVRTYVFEVLSSRIKVQKFQFGEQTAYGQSKTNQSGTIDGEWNEVEIKESEKPGDSGWTRH